MPGLIPPADAHRAKGMAGSFYRSISAIHTDGDTTNPLQIKNLLTAKTYAQHFLTLTNTQLSALVPRIRLWRINYKLENPTNPPVVDPNNPETEFYFHFYEVILKIFSTSFNCSLLLRKFFNNHCFF